MDTTLPRKTEPGLPTTRLHLIRLIPNTLYVHVPSSVSDPYSVNPDPDQGTELNPVPAVTDYYGSNPVTEPGTRPRFTMTKNVFFEIF